MHNNRPGQCSFCHGTGKTFRFLYERWETCFSCEGTGTCRYCGGTGDADSQLAKDLWYGRKDIANVAASGTSSSQGAKSEKGGFCGCLVVVAIVIFLYLLATNG